MEKAAEILEKAAVTLEKYRKNKTLVSPEDLAGKYKVPFEKLKQQLKDELSDFLKAYSLEELTLAKDEHGYFDKFAEDVNRIFETAGFGKRVGKAAFKDFDLEQVKRLAEELRTRIYNEAWTPYFHRHTCLYATAECFAENNPQTPKIYNSLVDKFWNDGTGEWTKNEEPAAPALLIYIQSDKAQEGTAHEQK